MPLLLLALVLLLGCQTVKPVVPSAPAGSHVEVLVLTCLDAPDPYAIDGVIAEEWGPGWHYTQLGILCEEA